MLIRMRSDTNWNASLSLKSQKRQALSQSGGPRVGPKVWAYQHLPCAYQHSQSAEQPSWVPGPHLSFGPIQTPFLRIFEPGIAPKRILICILKINPFFLDVQVFKVIIILQINIPKRLDYPQFLCYLIIHFILMQASLFLTLTNNQSQNYLINFNCLTNQN